MTDKLKAAEAEAFAARERLKGRYADLRAGAIPAALLPVGKVAGLLASPTVRKHGFRLAKVGLAAARRHPKVAAAVAVAGALFAFRKPIAQAWKKRVSKEKVNERAD